ncbi:MAG: hypothetical protein SOY38_03595, partial [Sodaliphilus sp.]|nr:hypothetical protein [Bacteroidales bacterium]MDY4075786.1 hypothetical protein [Sodaliphilus sp.]
ERSPQLARHGGRRITMGTPSALEVCRTELFTKVEDLQQKYPQTLVDKVIRVREMYNWFLSNPGGTDREFVSEVMQRHSVSKVTAYSDLAVVKTLMPLLASASRDFHRWHFNEMIMQTKGTVLSVYKPEEPSLWFVVCDFT